MFAGDTKNRQKSGQAAANGWTYANRNASAQQHSTAEMVAAQYLLRTRRPLIGGAAGGYAGNYDNTKGYGSGTIVRVTATTTISGVSVSAGLYAVAPGVSVPANGTGFQIPQYPEPTTFTASPNDQLYWHALVIYCGGI